MSSWAISLPHPLSSSLQRFISWFESPLTLFEHIPIFVRAAKWQYSNSECMVNPTKVWAWIQSSVCKTKQVWVTWKIVKFLSNLKPHLLVSFLLRSTCLPSLSCFVVSSYIKSNYIIFKNSWITMKGANRTVVKSNFPRIFSLPWARMTSKWVKLLAEEKHAFQYANILHLIWVAH